MNNYFSFPLMGYNIKSRIKNFMIWSIISICLFILIVVMFSNLLNAGLPEFVADMLASMPASVSGSNSGSALPDFKNFGVNFGVCLQLMLIVGCIYASFLGASANTGSRGDNDITFIYSLPVTRMSTVLSSYFAQIVILFFYNIIVFVVSLGVLYSNHKMNYLVKIVFAVLAFLFIEIVYLSVSFLLSTFMNTSSQASSVSAVMVTVTVLFGLVGSMSPALKALEFLSPYKYISVFSIVSGSGGLYFVGIVAGLLIALLCVVISCARYEKIDFLLD
ncbi:MAG: ABC transporter permease subunit [Acutalibacteraceae bacterium]|nr:ABC transporter permease subunit [Clostridia bacterium]MEE3449601.1 ABC transporter permease subunit [Acutalibacteraceae bacterium]